MITKKPSVKFLLTKPFISAMRSRTAASWISRRHSDSCSFSKATLNLRDLCVCSLKPGLIEKFSAARTNAEKQLQANKAARQSLADHLTFKHCLCNIKALGSRMRCTARLTNIPMPKAVLHLQSSISLTGSLIVWCRDPTASVRTAIIQIVHDGHQVFETLLQRRCGMAHAARVLI